MMTPRYQMFAALTLAAMTSMSHAQQQPNISGLTMNMPMSEAKAKLSSFTITPLHVSGYLPDLQVFAAVRDGEGFVVGAMDDKVTYVYRQLGLPFEKAVDQKSYLNQLVAKYGAPSSTNPLTWHWDGAGHLYSNGSGGMDAQTCVVQSRNISIAPIPAFQPQDFHWIWPRTPPVYFAVPTHDVAGCHTILSVSLTRSDTRVPANAVNFMYFEMSDPSMYFPAVSREIAKQTAAADAKRKATERNAGPPL